MNSPLARSLDNWPYLTITGRKHVDIIPMETLVRVEAWSNYSKLFLSDGRTLLASRVLKNIEKLLDSQMFIRAHSTHLVNIGFLSGINSVGDLCLVNGECIPVSRRRKSDVKRVLASQDNRGPLLESSGNSNGYPRTTT